LPASDLRRTQGTTSPPAADRIVAERALRGEAGSWTITSLDRINFQIFYTITDVRDHLAGAADRALKPMCL